MIKNRGELSMGKQVIITSARSINPVGLAARTAMYVSPAGELTIKDQVKISNSTIFCQDKITIQSDVMIGGGVQIYDSNFHSIHFSKRMMTPDSDVRTAPVIICKGSFIGASSIILKGVTIGEYSIVAAGSVVSKSIPNKEIWGGNPAKFIKRIDAQ